MNLIYICIFYQLDYINLLSLLLDSITKYSKINPENTEILIVTSAEFQPVIEQKIEHFSASKIRYFHLVADTLFDAGCARLHLFRYENIHHYDKILYLDTDILINSDVNRLFQLEIAEDKLYALEEGEISHDFWGGQFFEFDSGKYDRDNKAFSSGVLYFKNSHHIRDLFNDILNHARTHLENNLPITSCLDQPFIVYNAISSNRYDNQLLKTYVENNPGSISEQKVVYHFPGTPGWYSSKLEKMADFMEKMRTHTSKLKICQYGRDGFGHQLEGMLRIISLDLNGKADFVYDYRTDFTFEHSNFNKDELSNYLLKALRNLHERKGLDAVNSAPYAQGEWRNFSEIVRDDENHKNTIYLYDGVGSGAELPNNFEFADEIEKSSPILRTAFVENNPYLPSPSYLSKAGKKVCCHVRLGDAVGTRILDNNSLFDAIRAFQKMPNTFITIHSDGDVDHLLTGEDENTAICNAKTDVLQILSDFIHADVLIMTYSSLSIAAHLLANPDQLVICPNTAGPTFFHRILKKCIKSEDFCKINDILINAGLNENRMKMLFY